MAAVIAQLSSRLTESIANVEIQRGTLDEVILRLADQARHLSDVALVLTQASREQGLVLQELQRLLSMSVTKAPEPSGLPQSSIATPGSRERTSSPTTAGAPLSNGAHQYVPSNAIQPSSTSASSSGVAPAPAVSSSVAVRPDTPATHVEANAHSTQLRRWSKSSPIIPTPPPRPQVIEPDMTDEDGIEYVKNLRIEGALIHRCS